MSMLTKIMLLLIINSNNNNHNYKKLENQEIQENLLTIKVELLMMVDAFIVHAKSYIIWNKIFAYAKKILINLN